MAPVLILVPGLLPGQADRGAITGVVPDPSGAAIPGVEITATHPETETPIIQTDSAEVSTVVNSTEALVLPLTLARGLRNPMTFSGAFRRVLEGDEGTLSDEQPDCGRVVAQNLMAKREPQSVLPTVWNRVPRNSSVGED